MKSIDNIDKKVKIQDGKMLIGKKTSCESVGEIVTYLDEKFKKRSNAINSSIKEVKKCGNDLTNFLKSEFEKGAPKGGRDPRTVEFFYEWFIDPVSEATRKFSIKFNHEIDTAKAQLIDPVDNAYKKSSEKKKMEKEFEKLLKQGGDVRQFNFKSNLVIAIKSIGELSAWNKRLKRELPAEMERTKNFIARIKKRTEI